MTRITRIDPDLPLCWEDAETVRIGFERPVSRITRPTAAEQRLLGALCTGIPADAIDGEARRIGVSANGYRRLMDALQPALIDEHRHDPGSATGLGSTDGPGLPVAASPMLRIVISDDGRAAPGLREALGAFALGDVDADARAEESDLVVHVERYLEPLERAQRWRALGVPHLLVRFSDRAVHVGPIVEASGAPCHSCVSLELVARDSVLPVLAIQLHERLPRSETRPAGEFAAVYAALLIRQWRNGARAPRTTRWVIPVVHGSPTGTTRSEAVTPHPGCSCGDELDTAFARTEAAALSR